MLYVLKVLLFSFNGILSLINFLVFSFGSMFMVGNLVYLELKLELFLAAMNLDFFFLVFLFLIRKRRVKVLPFNILAV